MNIITTKMTISYYLIFKNLRFEMLYNKFIPKMFD